MRLVFILVFLVASACSSSNSDERRRPLDKVRQDPRCAESVDLYGHEPEGGVVSSEATAKEVAYSYLKRIYPEDDDLRRHMVASLKDGVWTLHGTLPKGYIGGVAGIALCQSNGRVLQITHTK